MDTPGEDKSMSSFNEDGSDLSRPADVIQTDANMEAEQLLIGKYPVILETEDLQSATMQIEDVPESRPLPENHGKDQTATLADGTSAPPDATSAPPDATSAPPDATSSPPDVTSTPPDATSSPPDVTSAPPNVTCAPPNVTCAPPNVTLPVPVDISAVKLKGVVEDKTPVEVVDHLVQSTDSSLTTPEEESVPKAPASLENERPSAGEETVDDREKVASERPEKKMEDGRRRKEGKKEAKRTKKGRDGEHMSRSLMQALVGLQLPEEKIAALCKKYAELLGEHKALQREHKTQQKQLVMLQRDRDQLQSEHGRAILAKSKLESLCRELQRHNKTIKEESLQRAREEEEKRKEVSAKFQQTINEITTQMQDNHTRNLRLKEENLELASKLKKLVEQYERREEHIEKIFKHKELESQLYDAKLQQSNLALAEEQERSKREKTILMNDTIEAHKNCEMLMKQETQLKAQLTVYTEKFEEFQTTLTKSNEIFQTFKQEIDQMTKKIKKLEKESNMWRVRWENSNKSLLNMAEESTIRDKEAAGQKNKITRLESLCRALQAERNALLGKARRLEANNPPPSPKTNKAQVIEKVDNDSEKRSKSPPNKTNHNPADVTAESSTTAEKVHGPSDTNSPSVDGTDTNQGRPEHATVDHKLVPLVNGKSHEEGSSDGQNQPEEKTRDDKPVSNDVKE